MSGNAVKIQASIAIDACVLVAIREKEFDKSRVLCVVLVGGKQDSRDENSADMYTANKDWQQKDYDYIRLLLFNIAQSCFSYNSDSRLTFLTV